MTKDKSESEDVCVIGGGLSGACTAHRLLAAGKSVTIFDARDRVGGRLLTAEGQGGGDLGGAWIWPKSEHAMQQFLDELGVKTVPMHLDGETMVRTHDGRRHVLPSYDASRYAACGGGAVRVPSGAASIVQRLLTSDNPNLTILLGLRVLSIDYSGDMVHISYAKSDSNIDACETKLMKCSSAVLAAPPKVIAKTITFHPPLANNKMDCMLGTQTWMSDYGKVSVSFPENWWRDLNMSAISIDQMGAVSTWWEACSGENGDGTLPTLAGFVTRDGATLLQQMGTGDALHDYVLQSLQDLYGVDVTAMGMPNHTADVATKGSVGIDGLIVSKGGIVVTYKSWLKDPFTNIQDGEKNDISVTTNYGDVCLQERVGPLFFAGTESAHGSGHMEGAVISAKRVATEVIQYLH